MFNSAIETSWLCLIELKSSSGPVHVTNTYNEVNVTQVVLAPQVTYNCKGTPMLCGRMQLRRSRIRTDRAPNSSVDKTELCIIGPGMFLELNSQCLRAVTPWTVISKNLYALVTLLLSKMGCGCEFCERSYRDPHEVNFPEPVYVINTFSRINLTKVTSEFDGQSSAIQIRFSPAIFKEDFHSHWSDERGEHYTNTYN